MSREDLNFAGESLCKCETSALGIRFSYYLLLEHKAKMSSVSPMDLDLDNRDPNEINSHITFDFENVLAEPDATHSSGLNNTVRMLLRTTIDDDPHIYCVSQSNITAIEGV
ncbi:hypothetical protein ScPMuIL_008517 [Solemya velum]